MRVGTSLPHPDGKQTRDSNHPSTFEKSSIVTEGSPAGEENTSRGRGTRRGGTYNLVGPRNNYWKTTDDDQCFSNYFSRLGCAIPHVGHALSTPRGRSNDARARVADAAA